MIPLSTAILIAIGHTLLGPDHYLPFIVIGRARRWSLLRTSLLTIFCGIGHVGSSIVLGYLGAVAGFALERVTGWESARGAIAGWSLLVFGVGYLAWGLRYAAKGKRHSHFHLHDDGSMHTHHHAHVSVLKPQPIHAHGHMKPEADNETLTWKQLTPWVLFIIFVLGPCEPLIPLFFVEAVRGNWGEMVSIVIGYSAGTILTMLTVVTFSWFGLRKLSFGLMERYSHALAGAALSLAGFGMVALGL